MKFSSSQIGSNAALLAAIQQAAGATPPPPKPRSRKAPKPATSARPRPATTAKVVQPGFPQAGIFEFIAAPLMAEGGEITPDTYDRFRRYCDANPATPWNHLLPAWCASEGTEDGGRRTEGGGQAAAADPEPEPPTQPEPEPEPPPLETENLTLETPPSGGGGPLVSELTGLLVPRWQHPMLPPSSRPVGRGEVPLPGTACFARLGDTWHPAEVLGMDAARRTLSVAVANTPHHGLGEHWVRPVDGLGQGGLANSVLPVDFQMAEPEPVAVATTEPEVETDEFDGLPDWVREMAEAE